MKKFTMFLCTMSLVFGVAGAASATIIPDDLAIDFRTSAWALAHGESEYTVGKVTAGAYDVAIPEYWNAALHQDGVDGLGVLGEEPDEIDSFESMYVLIEDGMMLNGVWITDLFAAPDGGETGEIGEIYFHEGASVYSFQFYGNDADQGNGEIWVDFRGEFLVSDALFVTYPWPDYDDNEFSVAGFTAAAVPEPATMLLLGAGLIGLAGLGRKRFVKKT